jgi:hypothetical protein
LNAYDGTTAKGNFCVKALTVADGGNGDNGGNGGSDCDAGFAGAALLALAGVLFAAKKTAFRR